MDEFKNAEQLARVLHAGREITGQLLPMPIYAYWAPGDATRYRVALVHVMPHVDSATDRAYTFLLVTAGGTSLTIEKPGHGVGAWTAERWLRVHGAANAGWWAGIRPLLAALNWTTWNERDTAYSPASAIQIGELLR